MSQLTINEYRQILESDNYEIDADTLRELTERLGVIHYGH